MTHQTIQYEIGQGIDAILDAPSRTIFSGTFFHQALWCEVLEETYGYDSRTITLRTEAGDVASRLNLCIVRGIFGTRLVSLPFSDYGGPLIVKESPDSVAVALTEAVDKVADECHARYVLFKSTTSEMTDPLLSQGFRPIDYLGTLVVPLAGRAFSDIETGFDKDVRRRMRKGVQDGLEVTSDQSEKAIKSFYKLYLRDMKRHGSPPHKKKYFEKIWEKFGGSAHLRLLGCSFRGKEIGYSLHFLFGDTALFYMGVWPGSARGFGVAPFLIGNSIRIFAEEGYKYYDFGRTTNHSGEYLFKKSFGGEYRPLGAVVRMYKGDEYLEPINWKYKALSASLKRMPLSVLGRIGPRIKRQLE